VLCHALAHTSRRVVGARNREPSAHPMRPHYVQSHRELRFALLRLLSHRPATWSPRGRSLRSISVS